eukprot:1161549-Pelagomonas_calceolata.AAC.7
MPQRNNVCSARNEARAAFQFAYSMLLTWGRISLPLVWVLRPADQKESGAVQCMPAFSLWVLSMGADTLPVGHVNGCTGFLHLEPLQGRRIRETNECVRVHVTLAVGASTGKEGWGSERETANLPPLPPSADPEFYALHNGPKQGRNFMHCTMDELSVNHNSLMLLYAQELASHQGSLHRGRKRSEKGPKQSNALNYGHLSMAVHLKLEATCLFTVAHSTFKA